MNRLNIIVATWNSSKTLRRFFESVIYQELDIRVFIQDNCSKDETISICNDYINLENKKIELIVVSCEDSGIYSAWNKVLRQTSLFNKDDFIMFLGGDDYLEKDFSEKIQQQFYLLKENDVLYSDIFLCYDNGCKTTKYTPREANKKIKSYMSFSHPSMIVNYKIFDKLCFFDERFKIAGDYDFTLRLCSIKNVNFIKLDSSPVVNFSYGGVSSNMKFRSKSLSEKLKVKIKNKVNFIFLFDIFSLKSLFSIIVGKLR